MTNRTKRISLAAIRRYAQQIADRFHPEPIVLLGSQAYGRPHADSDVDIFVVMPGANDTKQAIGVTLTVP